jgi:probable HAF family extracellular repeat protein
MIPRSTLALTFALSLLARFGFAQQFNYISIEVQCAPTAAPSTCPSGLAPGQVAAQTSAQGINARGDIVGMYVAGGVQHGFLLTDGQFTSLDFPIANVRGTAAKGINPQGEIVGTYVVPVNHDPNIAEDSPLYCPTAADAACTKGFFYRHGKYSIVLFPGHPGAVPQRITPDGDIYGCLHDHDLNMSMYGAIWSRFETDTERRRTF